MATLVLAEWAANLNSSTIPTDVSVAVQRTLFNWLGCTIYGHHHGTVQKARKALQPFFGPPQASLIGGDIQVDIQHAALLNGIASHVHDNDDTHLATIIHPGGPVASAAVAYAQYAGSVSGAELETALIVGIEAECKLGLAVWPSHYDIGWHITSTTGAIGAAVAVGRLMRLSVQNMAHAIGIASVQVNGLRTVFGTDTKSFNVGAAARAGLTAALLAQQGFTSGQDVLEAKRGWANVVTPSGRPRLDELLGQLGQIWEVKSNAFKPFPCGIVAHPAIDAAIQLRQKLCKEQGPSVAFQDLHFRVEVHPLVIELTSNPAPKDGLEAKFSVAHGVAVGLFVGKAGPAQYTDEAVADPNISDLTSRVQALSKSELKTDEAVLKVLSANGMEVNSLHVQHAIGSVARPMTDEELVAKFKDQVGLVYSSGVAEEVAGRAWTLTSQGSMIDALRMLTAVLQSAH